MNLLTARSGPAASVLGLLIGAAVLGGCGSSSDARATDDGSTAGSSSPPVSTSPTTPATSTTATTPADPSGAATPAPALPTCSSVWVARATLPQHYDGCTDGATTVPADGHSCSFGGTVVAYDDRFYALTGHVINEVPHVLTSQQYREALSECQA